MNNPARLNTYRWAAFQAKAGVLKAITMDRILLGLSLHLQPSTANFNPLPQYGILLSVPHQSNRPVHLRINVVRACDLVRVKRTINQAS